MKKPTSGIDIMNEMYSQAAQGILAGIEKKALCSVAGVMYKDTETPRPPSTTNPSLSSRNSLAKKKCQKCERTRPNRHTPPKWTDAARPLKTLISKAFFSIRELCRRRDSNPIH